MHAHDNRSTYLRIALRILAIIALALPLAPQPNALAQEVVPQADCPDHVRLAGPSDGSPDSYYPFTATVVGATGLLSLAIDWYKDGVLQTSVAESPSTQEYSWLAGGVKSVSVTVRSQIPGRTCPTVSAERSIIVSPLPLSDVPLGSYRLAAQLLEEQRAVAPDWADAGFTSPVGPTEGAVTPLYRPGITGPAYYEFPVYGPYSDESHERGFIIVSTGDHDHPITNWATDGWSPTRRLRAESGWTAVKFWKLDTLSYVAEDKNGAAVAYDGDTPPKIISTPSGWLDNPVVTSSWKPQLITDAADLVDGSIPVVPSTFITPTLSEFPELGAWADWTELRTGYAANYAPLITALRESAAPEWEALGTSQEQGWVLHKGDSVSYPLPYADPVVDQPYGPAIDQNLIKVDLVAPAGLGPRLVFEAIESLPGQGVPMTTTVTYGNGITETLKAMVLHELPYSVYLPLVVRGGAMAGAAEAGTGSASAPVALPLTASPAAMPDGVEAQTSVPGTLAADGYTYWYVGGTTQAEADAQQAWYDQYPLDGCQSGCGPTAWAMLIAWGDRRAHLDPLGWWVGRTGLYRDDGGRGDPAVMAPRWWDDADQGAGVKLMMEEINDAMDTGCSGDSGYTKPWRMDDVIDYLNGRSQVSLNIWWLPLGTSLTGNDAQAVRTKARNVIKNPMESRRPTIVGTGWFSHYPLAYGYRDKTVEVCSTSCKLVWGKTVCTPVCTNQYWSGFLVNQGWGNTTGEWVSSDIWFAGRLTPHQSGANDTGLYRTADDTAHFDVDHDLEDTFYFRYAAGTMPYALRPATGDFDRDGLVDDLAYYVYSFWDSAKRYDWYFDEEANNSVERTLDAWTTATYGDNGWPLALDFDRDGFVDDLAVYYPSYLTGSGICYRPDMDGTKMCTGYVGVSDKLLPVTGDLDRDGYHDDLGFYDRASRQWAFDLDHDGDFDGGAVPWPAGLGADAKPFAGDLDQDGFPDDVGAYDPATRTWYFDKNHDGSPTSESGFGEFYDLPFAGNFWNN